MRARAACARTPRRSCDHLDARLRAGEEPERHGEQHERSRDREREGGADDGQRPARERAERGPAVLPGVEHGEDARTIDGRRPARDGELGGERRGEAGEVEERRGRDERRGGDRQREDGNTRRAERGADEIGAREGAIGEAARDRLPEHLREALREDEDTRDVRRLERDAKDRSSVRVQLADADAARDDDDARADDEIRGAAGEEREHARLPDRRRRVLVLVDLHGSPPGRGEQRRAEPGGEREQPRARDRQRPAEGLDGDRRVERAPEVAEAPDRAGLAEQASRLRAGLVDRGEHRAEPEQREAEAPEQSRGDDRDDEGRIGVERGGDRAEDDRQQDQAARRHALVQAGGERVRDEAHPAVRGEDHPDEQGLDAEARRAHRQEGVEERVADEARGDGEGNGERGTHHSAAVTASAARYSDRGATLYDTALARSAVTTASAVSSEVRHGTRASTAARRMRKPSRSTSLPSVGVFTTAAHPPERMRRMIASSPSASFGISRTGTPSVRQSAAVPRVATMS